MACSNLAYLDARYVHPACANQACDRPAVRGRKVCIDCVGTIWDEGFVPGGTASLPLLDAGRKREVERVDMGRLCRADLRLIYSTHPPLTTPNLRALENDL